MIPTTIASKANLKTKGLIEFVAFPFVVASLKYSQENTVKYLGHSPECFTVRHPWWFSSKESTLNPGDSVCV
jgi:hypothetical protein